MREIIFVVAALIAFLANVPYIIDTHKGKTKPNIATWSSWVLINIIAVAAAFSANAYGAALLSFANFLGLSIIVVIGLRRGTRKYTSFDFLCQGLAITGLVLWQISGNPNIALTFAVIADVCAILPTFRHSYLYPDEETWITFFVAGLAALVIAIAAETYTYAALVMPINIFLANAVVVSIVLIRRNKLAVITDK